MLLTEINANGRYELSIECAIGVLLQKTGFANTRIAW